MMQNKSVASPYIWTQAMQAVDGRHKVGGAATFNGHFIEPGTTVAMDYIDKGYIALRAEEELLARKGNSNVCVSAQNVAEFVQNMQEPAQDYTLALVDDDNAVEHPSHYNMGKIEVIDAIEDWQLNFSRGNAVKYIARAGHKQNELEDLRKARFYIAREISRLEALQK